jgi:hypothetical protein
MSELMKQAAAVYAKHRFEIDGKFDAFKFFKAKFVNDQNEIRIISKLLYKKIK